MDWVTEIIDPERRLALAYASGTRRNPLALLWALDERLGAIVAATREEPLGRIRLAWWRDALEALSQGAPAGEPLLQGLSELIGEGGLDASELARLPEGWAALLGPLPLEMAALRQYAVERGGALFQLSATIFGSDADVSAAGEAWALIDFAARVSDRDTAEAARSLAGERLASCGSPPVDLRPLSILTALARHDQRRGFPRRQGSPRRLAIALRAAVIGR